MSRLNIANAWRRRPVLSPAIAVLAGAMVLMLLSCSGLCQAACGVENPVVPDAEVTVIDAETGEPLDGATVELLRGTRSAHGERASARQTETTDSAGVATFEEETAVTQLMIQLHAPDEHFWIPCARHEGYETVKLPHSERLIMEDYNEQHGPWEVTLETSPGESTPCDPESIGGDDDVPEFEQDTGLGSHDAASDEGDTDSGDVGSTGDVGE